MKYLALFALIFVIGCTGATTTAYSTLAIPTANIFVSSGDRVSFEYTLKFEDGTPVESGTDEIIIGTGQKILQHPLDDTLSGMKISENKKIILSPEFAYGEYIQGKTVSLPINQLLEEGIIPVEGMTVILNSRPRIIKEVSGNTATIDLNHPNAGKTVVLDIEVTNIR